MLRTLALSFGLLVASMSDAEACRCLQPDVITSYQSRDHAVVARAVSVVVGAQDSVWTFRLVKDVKECGRPGTTFRVVTASSSAACGASFTPGVTYLLFASDSTAGGRQVWRTSSCDGNREISQVSRADVSYLMNRPLFCGAAPTCVSGNQPMNCLVDPCSVSPACPGATCASNYCGGCTAEWYDVAGAAQCTPW
jgi:hypothetical protein